MQRYNIFLKYANFLQKYIFSKKKRVYTCICQKKAVILQRKMVWTKKQTEKANQK